MSDHSQPGSCTASSHHAVKVWGCWQVTPAPSLPYSTPATQKSPQQLADTKQHPRGHHTPRESSGGGIFQKSLFASLEDQPQRRRGLPQRFKLQGSCSPAPVSSQAHQQVNSPARPPDHISAEGAQLEDNSRGKHKP